MTRHGTMPPPPPPHTHPVLCSRSPVLMTSSPYSRTSPQYAIAFQLPSASPVLRTSSPYSRTSPQYATAFQLPSACTSTSRVRVLELSGGQARSKCQHSMGRDRARKEEGGGTAAEGGKAASGPCGELLSAARSPP